MVNANTNTRMNSNAVSIDLRFQNTPGVIASWLVSTSNGWALVDTGPDTARTALEEGVGSFGLEMRDITRVILTHIHLDHAGAVGTLVRDYPHLRVTVHEGSAGILVEPSRLIRSAAISFGDEMNSLWGDIIGVDPDRIDSISPGETVRGTSLQSIATPGHTATHLAYLDSRNGMLFTGDSAHARLQNSDVIVPTLSPVEVDIEAWRETARTLRRIAPSALALPHFGLVENAADHLALLEDRIHSRMVIAERTVRSPDDIDALAHALADTTYTEFVAEGGDTDAKFKAMELSMPSWLGAQGIMRWYKVHNKFPAN